MDRRSFLRGLIALPVVAALAPLLPKAIKPTAHPIETIGIDLASASPKPVRLLTGYSQFSGTNASTMTMRIGLCTLAQGAFQAGSAGVVKFDQPILLRDNDEVIVTFDTAGHPSAVPPLVDLSETWV